MPVQATQIKEVACIGVGLIGSGWATNFLMKGLSVRVYDPAAEQLALAEARIRANLELLETKGLLPPQSAERMLARARFTSSLEQAVKEVLFIQESGPENYHIKRAILAETERFAPQEAIFASSTSGLLISEIAKEAVRPELCLGAHPYNPPYLIPLVEISKSGKTSGQAVKVAFEFYSLLGKEPIILQKEAPGFVANRLAMALYREAVELVMRGVCTVEDVDKAVCFGPGLRYAALGPNLLYHLGGGAHGIRGILAHIGPSVELWWADMADWKKWPEGWGDLAEKGVREEMANRSPAQGQTSEDIVRFRDNMLLEILRLHGKL